jgi:hypothetical protein
MSNLDPAEEGGARDLLVVKEDLYLVCDGLFRCKGDQTLPASQNLINEINIWSSLTFKGALEVQKRTVCFIKVFITKTKKRFQPCVVKRAVLILIRH